MNEQSTTVHNMDESHNTEREKSNTKEYTLYNSIYIRNKKQSELWNALRSQEHEGACGNEDNIPFLNLGTCCMGMLSV